MPSYDWVATAGKKYSLLCVGLSHPWVRRGAMIHMIHYFAYNVRNGNAVTKDLNTTLGTWRAPTQGQFGSPGVYAHLLFEHDVDLDFDRSATMGITGSTAATDRAAFMAAVGLHNTTLVSLNWMVVSGAAILTPATGDLDRCELSRRIRLGELRRCVQAYHPCSSSW
jgi:hypothetical protein